MFSGRWLLAAVTASVALILGAPYIGQLRGIARDRLGSGFVTAAAVIVGLAAAVVVITALRRITHRHVLRYGVLAAAAIIAVIYSWIAATGDAETDANERFHFVEYGVVTMLFYRAWRPARDGAVLWLPFLASLSVGIAEEWLQWFVPARVGEARDVLLNTVAIGCGLLVSVALDPPVGATRRLTRRSRTAVALLATVALLLFGGFVHAAHLVHEIADPDVGVFRSRHDAVALSRVARERVQRWRGRPPTSWTRLSQEDQYLTEGVAHVQRRNERWAEGHLLAAHHENLILEKYYAPVLDTPSYVSATGHRWPEDQKQQAGAATVADTTYASDALRHSVVSWPAWAWWLGITAAVSATVTVLKPWSMLE